MELNIDTIQIVWVQLFAFFMVLIRLFGRADELSQRRSLAKSFKF